MFCAKINNLLDFVMNMVKICISAGGNKSPCLRQKSKQSKQARPNYHLLLALRLEKSK